MIDLAILFGTAISAGSAVYAFTRDARVRLAIQDRDYWEKKHTESRNEIHQIREEWQGDKLELERLRAETNYAPLEKKLDGFINSQTTVNNALNATCKSLHENLTILTNLMGRLVPALIADEEKRQDEKI